ncbi:F-box protein SKIP22-like [Hevea brasiliensis]|uniref:F-box protein SKIP22-like n=1 Tax=Hevea brasiliensis TaxID=3981 RepID=UPI0025D23D12|nr:F-box protein SKIP22-like [Hevea brasiliensis]
MKLRLRSLQTKETVKVEVPNECTLQQLKETLSHALCSSSSSFCFSLNRKEGLSSSSLQDSLQSLGITSGDLIYFSHNPDVFSRSPQMVGSGSGQSLQEEGRAQHGNLQAQSMNFKESSTFGPNLTGKQETPDQDLSVKETKFLGASASIEKTLILDLPVEGQSDAGDEVIEEQRSLISNTQMGETLETEELSSEEGMDIDNGSLDVDFKRISEPCFLKRVLREELGDDISDNKLLFIAIHAVFLESGFVGFDSVSGLRVDLFHLLEEQSSMSFTTSVSYTLPELLLDDTVTESVILRFQTLGHFVNVYGSLAKNQCLYRSCLNKSRFVPSIGCLLVNCDKGDRMNENDGSSRYYPENEVFELWKIVKDQLALPLLIDLCEKTGLGLPPCLVRLPADLKLRILESLPGVDIARMACVSKEMRYMSSNNDLWKKKFTEEFGTGAGSQGKTNWKARFASSWELKKKRKRQHLFRRIPLPFYIVSEPGPDPFHGPLPMVGGDYDRLPGLGVPFPCGQPGLAFPRFRTRRNFSPNCNLGGFNG